MWNLSTMPKGTIVTATAAGFSHEANALSRLPWLFYIQVLKRSWSILYKTFDQPWPGRMNVVLLSCKRWHVRESTYVDWWFWRFGPIYYTSSLTCEWSSWVYLFSLVLNCLGLGRLPTLVWRLNGVLVQTRPPAKDVSNVSSISVLVWTMVI